MVVVSAGFLVRHDGKKKGWEIRLRTIQFSFLCVAVTVVSTTTSSSLSSLLIVFDNNVHIHHEACLSFLMLVFSFFAFSKSFTP